MTAPLSSDEGKDFIRLVGCPRSGTFLLATLMTGRLGVAFPVETHFAPLFQRYQSWYGDLARKTNRRRLLADIYNFLEIFTRTAYRNSEFAAVEQVSLLATRRAREQIVENSGGYSDLVESLYQEFARQQGLPRYGDKSVPYYPIDLGEVSQLFPRLKVIHMVRDARDVAMSWTRTWFRPGAVSEAGRLWGLHVSRYSEWGVQNPNCYFELRYEDLVEDPESSLALIASFLGTNLDSLSSNAGPNPLAEIVSAEASHQLLNKPVTTQSKGKWRTAMSSEDRRAIERLVGSLLEERGYETESVAPRAGEHSGRSQVGTGSSLRSRIGLHSLRLRVKNFLPLLLLASRVLHLPLTRIYVRWDEWRRSKAVRGSVEPSA